MTIVVGSDNVEQFETHMPSHGNAEANFNHSSGVILVIDETNKVNLKNKENENQCQAESKLDKNPKKAINSTLKLCALPY